VVLVPQVSHAWLAWQIAEHWGNRQFLRPAPRAETLAAILLHDTGWTAYDGDPALDDDGRILAFDSMPLDVHLGIWETSVTQSAQVVRYAGLVVAAHHRLLAARKGAALPPGESGSRRRISGFIGAMEQLEAEWIDALRGDPRAGRFIDGIGRRANQAILSACDRISVHLCAAIQGPFTVQAVTASGIGMPIRVEPAGRWRWRLNPWPLEGRRLTVHCEGRAVDTPVFPDRAALRAALAEAPRVRLSFTLARSSERFDG